MKITVSYHINKKSLKIFDHINFTRKIHKGLNTYPNLKFRLNQSRRDENEIPFRMIGCLRGVIKHPNDSSKDIKIERPFFLCDSEVTQELYQQTIGFNPSEHQSSSTGKCPVDSITPYDAMLFCNKLSLKYGLKPYYVFFGTIKVDGGKVQDISALKINRDSNGFRLPSHYEWQYAAYAGTENLWAGCNDKDRLVDYAWITDNSDKRTHPVKTKLPNDWGFYDMSGNVEEITFYPNEDECLRDKKVVCSGGKYRDGGKEATYPYANLQISKFLTYYSMGYDNKDVGFRIARNIPYQLKNETK
jgi:formylglycine-generating enzyme required for sulfatase activity